MINKRGQVTIFIIIAILIVGAALILYIFRGSLFKTGMPSDISPVYTSFLECIETYTKAGADILGTQAGYIYLPEFEPGSSYMPFSSRLNFFGNSVPYWYYVSGNNIQKEQVPSKSQMEEQLGKFIEEKIRDCNLKSYYEQGFQVNFGEKPEAKARINEKNVEIDLSLPLTITKGEESSRVTSHKITVDSKLGKFYELARKIYNYEQDNLFLEKYAVDTLRLYAPVDGVELTCSPKTWIARNVSDELQNAIEANTLALKIKGDYYTLKEKENKYFIIDISSDEKVNFLNSKGWAYFFEVEPSEGEILIAKPVGNQPGLGILGFCYVPYHFVYNVGYPVLVQIYDETEIFQFPIAVIVKNNVPREPIAGTASEFELPELCKYKNTLVGVRAYNTELEPVEADISFECFGTKCDIGKTKNGILNEKFPQCVNGYIIARAQGYEDAKYLISTNVEGSADVILDKLYNMEINLKVDGLVYNKNAIVTFSSEKGAKTIVYPEQKTIKLSEGQYEVSVYVYRDSSLTISATTREQCVEVPASGLGGIFGFTKQECFNIEMPSQTISQVLAGGGKTNYYITESELKSSKKIEINAPSLPVPTTLEQLQDNYMLFEDKTLDINFK